MTKRMLIDASHAEETRVVVLDGNRLEDFDVETSTKRQLKGNIYLAKVVRVEPSLQAAFVEYGGNRHGFLAFSEIHPDYYQIPVADRQRLIEMEAEEARLEEEEEDRAAGHPPVRQGKPQPARESHAQPAEPESFAQDRVAQDRPAAEQPAQQPAGGFAAPAAETGDESGATGTMPETAPSASGEAPQPEPPRAETTDESGATVALLEAAAPAEAPPATASQAEPPAAQSPGAEGGSANEAEGNPPAQENPVSPAEPAPPAAQTSDESGATSAMLGDGTERLQAEPSQAEPSQTGSSHAESSQAEPPQTESSRAEASQAAAATPADGAALAEPPATAQAPEPPAAETGDESGATGPMLEAGDEPDPSGSRRRAQPMVIEPERISGPVSTEAADEASEADRTDPAGAWHESAPAADSPVADTLADSGASVAMLAGQQDEGDTAIAERPEHPRRGRRRSSEEDEPFNDDESEFGESLAESPPPETLGGEQDNDDRGERRMPPRFMRNYKIQEVIKRRQIMLVQVVKEERGTKGAALTTYISLAGRFSVLMPNSPRGGGISRKITSATDRRRLKEIVTEMDMPKGMGLIVRTAGANRPKPEIKRDCEYLLRLWDDIREHTLKSVAPALIYEEASLIKRAIRDVYSRDIDEITVDGEEGWRQAHEFMRMLMPSHAKKVQLWRDSQPLFARSQVESQLDNMLLPTVQLRSGGYLVINQTEALVAIDVNSGRSTRERNVEETALRTNLEAADEAARQLRLRDLAGLIVIDFIDMESRKHNAMVEKRLKDALKNDRARIQVGHISHFGLLEMSRQRLRPSLAETSFIACPHCGGTGHVRSTESAALHVLRGIEEEGSKRRSAEIVVHVATPIALYILNHKRDRLNEIELRYAMRVTLSGDDRQIEPQYRIDRLRPQTAAAAPAVITPDMPQPALTPPPPLPPLEPEAEEEEAVSAEEAETEDDARDSGEEPQAEAGGEISAEEAERRRRRRRRRRRGRRDEVPGQPAEQAAPVQEEQPAKPDGEPQAGAPEPAVPAEETHIEGVPEHAEAPSGEEDEDGRGRRRGRRGGRRRRREPGERETPLIIPDVEQPDLPPVYTGPTPANPFGGHAFDIFDILERAEGLAGQPAAAGEPEVTVTPAQEQAAAAAPLSEPAQQLEIVNSSAPEPAAEELGRTEPEAPPPDGLSPAVEARSGGTPEASAEAASELAPQPAAADAVEATAEAPRAAEAGAAPAPAEAAAEAGSGTVAPEPAPSEPEPSAEPAVKPIIIGAPDEPPVEKKRGWWRR